MTEAFSCSASRAALLLRKGLLCLLLLFVCLSCSHRKEDGEDRSIVIIYENDVHCHINGYARMRGLADAVSDTAWVGLTSSGDFLSGGTAGSISVGAYIVDIMKEMRYDAVGLGNHEFDFGMPRMLSLLQEADIPVTSSNLRALPSDSLLFPPYLIRRIGKKSVAFIGVVTTESMVGEGYSFFDKEGNRLYDLCEDSLTNRVQAVVDEVHSLGVDHVVLLSHLGEVSPRGFLTSRRLIASTTGVDAVLDGHTHSTIPCEMVKNRDGRAIPLTQTGALFANVGKLVIKPDGRCTSYLIPIDSIRHESVRVRQVTDSILHLMEQTTAKPVCRCDFPVSIHDTLGRQAVRFRETAVGNIVSDAFRAVSGAQLAVNNGGGIRTDMPVGEWTYGDVVALLPYNDYLHVVKITGAELLELLVRTTAHSPFEDGQFPQISGFRFTLDTSAEGKDRVSEVEVYDEKTRRYTPLRPDASYTLCTTDYCITGGGMYGILRNAPLVRSNLMLYCDALALYVTRHLHGEIPDRYRKTEGRILLRQ